jgi:hypothetical protein
VGGRTVRKERSLTPTVSHSIHLVSRPFKSNALLRQLRFGSRAKRQKRRWPAVIAWVLGALTGIGALLVLAALHGDPPEPSGEFPDPALATLARPGVAALAAFGAVLLIGWCVRRLRLEFLAWWPGRIVVHKFVADKEVPDADLERLTAGFRDRLGMSHLQSPAATPAPAERGDYLDVLAQGTLDPQNLVSSLVTLLRASAPTHAYEVKGALVTGDGPMRHGVTVQVVRLPGKGCGGHTVWDTTPERAMRRAADHAAASILPRTRVCRSPWAGWRRYYLPSSLFEAYEQAAELERDRRYDEALHLYLKAVGEDPKNLALRLQLGFLQEKLALYLDALDTYESILQVASHTTPADEHVAPRSRDPRKPARLAAGRERERALLVARYRRAVLLGGGELARQWGKWGPKTARTRRDKQRERLRERLAPRLEALFRQALRSRAVIDGAEPIFAEVERDLPSPEACRTALEEPRGAGDQGTREELEQLLLLASLREFDHLHESLPRVPIRRTTLTRAAVKVSSLVVRERLRWVVSAQGFVPRRGWDEYIKEIGHALDRIENGRDFDRWQEHYNAACIYALPLLPRDGAAPRGDDVEKLTRVAIHRLELAVEKADSEYIASRRDWLVSEDPDLRGLRSQPLFKRFEAAYLPSPARAPRRPLSVQKWEVSRYTLRLLQASARRWEDAWEQRTNGLSDNGDVRTLLRWSGDEVSAWHLMREVGVHYRAWDTRYKLVAHMRQWSAEYDFEPVEVAFPRFSVEDEIQLRGSGRRGEGRDLERATVAAIRDKDARLRRFVRLLDRAVDAETGRAYRPPRDLKEFRVALGRLEAGGQELPRARVARLCGLHADLWRRLGALLEPDEHRKAAGDELEQALVNAAVAWRTLEGQSARLGAARSGDGSGPVKSAA